MTRQANRFGGGAKTNANGLYFEQTTDLNYALESAGYHVINGHVFFNDREIGISAPKARIYRDFLSPNGIDYRDYNSKGWQPDEAFINFQTQTAYIIEKKFQNGAGSVDEKLPGCHFKKLEYEKLFHPLRFNVEFIYVFNDWFRQPVYFDILDYIENMGCLYCFNEIPLEWLGL